MAPKNNARFARIVAEAFAALGVTQTELQQRGGPSDTTLRKIIDGADVGISTRTLNRLDAVFQWAPGSAARTLAGGDPLRLSDEADEFLSKIRHPQHAVRVANAIDEGDSDLIATLDNLLTTGQLPAGAQAQLERLRDDQAIELFPKLYDALSRGGKLRVAIFGRSVYQEELEECHVVETSPESDAQAQGGQVEEAGGLLDEPEPRTTFGGHEQRLRDKVKDADDGAEQGA